MRTIRQRATVRRRALAACRPTLWPQSGSGATDVPRDAILSWMPGPYAATHDVYFGTSVDSVTNAERTNPLGVLVNQGQDANTYDPPDI